MKYSASTLAVLLSVLCALPDSALAQKTYALGVAGGVAIPTGKLNQSQEPGFNGTVGLAIGMADLPLGVRFDAIYNRFNEQVFATSAQPIASAPFSLRISGILGNLIYAAPGTTAKPYFIAGAGLYSIRADSTGAKSQNSWGFNAGLGATFGIGPFATYIESRYHSISRSVAKGGVVQFIPITIGFLF